MNAFRIRYRAKSGIAILPITGTECNGKFTVLHPHGWYQNFAPKEWDLTLTGAMEKAKTLKCKKLEAYRRRMEKLNNITILTWEEP